MTIPELKNKISIAEKVVNNERIPAEARSNAKNNIKIWQDELAELEKSTTSTPAKKNRRKTKPVRAKRSKKTKDKVSENKPKTHRRKKPLRSKRTKPVKAKKPKTPRKPRVTKPKKEKLATPPEWLVFIRKFVTYYANKSVKVETLTKYTEALQDKFQANPKRAKTPNIDEIRLIQEILVKAVNSAGRKDKVKVEVTDTYLAVMKTAIRNFTVARGKDRVYPKFENSELSGIKKKVRK